jgi:hypothetical protein
LKYLQSNLSINMNETQKAFFQSLDLEGLPEEERQEFIDDVGDLVLKAILEKAWMELDSGEKESLTQLLEQSEADPDNEMKSSAVFAFLDEHVSNIAEYAQKEFEKLQNLYRETRDELLDAGV